MNKAELQRYVRNNTGLEMDSMNSMSEIDQLRMKDGIVGKIWHTVRPAFVTLGFMFKIKKGWRIAYQAFITLMDEFYGTGKL